MGIRKYYKPHELIKIVEWKHDDQHHREFKMVVWSLLLFWTAFSVYAASRGYLWSLPVYVISAVGLALMMWAVDTGRNEYYKVVEHDF